MRDIDRRLRRYRLSRYATPDDAVRRRLRWVWLAGLLWLAWIGLFSDHSVWRWLRLGREHARTTQELARTEAETRRLEHDLEDPRLARERAEKALREEAGMAGQDEIVYRVDDVVRDSLAPRP
jgi:cell division protein FtsB